MQRPKDQNMSSASYELVPSKGPTLSNMAFMQPIPSTAIDMYSEARCLGLLGFNASFKGPRMKLLSYIYASTKIGRCPSQASILLVGSSGVGKSSTINHLLDNYNHSKTNDKQSETRITSEFILRAVEPKYEVEDLQLSLVDTPGFNDTDGTRQDACNFYSIKRFYETHPKLSGCFPNLVFLVVQAFDTRIEGPNSNLSKSLRCLKELGLVDQCRPNVVAILSFCCSISYKNVAKWSEKIRAKKRVVQEVIFQTLKVTPPVVILENDYGKDGEDLEVFGKFTYLPNRELQPQNLYNACEKVLSINNDYLGLVILNAFYAKQTEEAPTVGYKFKAKYAKHEKLDKEEENFVKYFEETARGGVKGDPIFDIAQQYIEKKKLKPELQQEVQELASTLKRMGIEERCECAYITEGSVEYFHGDTISSIGAEMLQQEFLIPKKVVSLPSGYLIGQGYNILNDKPVPCQIIKFETASNFGIVVPACAKFEIVEEMLLAMDQFDDEQSYKRSRLTNLNVSLDVEIFNFQGKTRAGCNKSSNVTGQSSETEYSFLLEQRMFKLKLANYEEYIRKREIAFTSDFKSAVEKLPKIYDKNNAEHRSSFKRFFDRFGHFVVSSAYGGGAIEIKVTSRNVGNKPQSFNQVKAALLTSIGCGLWNTSGKVSSGQSSSTSDSSKSLLSESTTVHWFGGNRHLHKKDTVTQREEMLKWKTSLLVNPVMLTTKMTLEPITTLIACVDREKDQASYNALEDFLGGKFLVVACIEPGPNKVPVTTAAEDNPYRSTKDPEEGTTCFPSKSLVLVKDVSGNINQKQMVDLCVGDKVLAWDSRRLRVITSEVIMFAHRQPNAVDVEYLKIILQDGISITLSANHLVMTGKHCKATMAQNVKQDHVLYTMDERGALTPKKVIAVKKITESGVFCPITKEGNLLVNNVLASCYASVNDHTSLNGLFKVSAQNVAHLGLMPMRILRKFHSKWVSTMPKDEYIHPYIKWLCKLKLPCMDGR